MQDNFDSMQIEAWDIRAATEVKPETPAELHQYIRTYYRTPTGEKVIIPTRQMCQGHNAPFEFVSDAFFGIHHNQIAKANRNGGKTLDFGVINHLGSNLLGNEYPLKVLSIGAVQEQAEKCFKYSASIWNQEEFRHRVARGGMLKESIVLANGSEIETGVATVKRVNGPHVPWFNLDEFELWDWDTAQQSFSIPESQGPHRASIRIASTQKYAYGNMQRFMEEAEQRGFKVYKWCIWETIEQCRDRACSTCPIFEWPDKEGGELCGGRAKDARGFYRVDDFVGKVKSLDRRTLEEEWLCLRPSREGIVFGREYREDIHRLGYELPYQPQLPLYLSIDQGFTNPFAVLICQHIENIDELLVLDEVYRTETIPEEMAKITADHLEALGVPEDTKIPLIFDAEDPAAARTFVKHLTSSKGRRYYAMLRRAGVKPDLEERHRLCRRRLKLEVGKAQFLGLSNRVSWLPYELTQYRYPQRKGEDRPVTEKPIDKDNHAISAWYRLEEFLAGPPKAKSDSMRIM
jgi:hypothetical protein